MSGKIVLLEGADCSGKTTIAKRLVEDVDGIYYHNPAGVTPLTNDFYNHVLKKVADQPMGITRLLQLAGNALNAHTMNQLREAGNFVVSDRNLLSTIVYQRMEPHDIQEIMGVVGAETYKFDCAILLTNSYETMLKRMDVRGEPDAWDKHLIDHGHELIGRYRKYAPLVYRDVHIIETDNLSLDEVYEQVKKIALA